MPFILADVALDPDLMLALLPDNEAGLPSGQDVKEPVYGAPARWIRAKDQEDAALSGATIVSPAEVLATHLLETVKRNFGRLMTLKSLRRILDELVKLSNDGRANDNKRLLDEMIPDKVPVDTLLAVMRLLLEEQVSVRNLPLILEAVAELRAMKLPPEAICEHVRQKLGFQIVAGIKRDDGTIPLIQLAPDWEETFRTYQIDGDNAGLDVALPPEAFEKLTKNVADEIGTAQDRGVFPALVTSARRRRFLRTILSAKGVQSPVLSFEEIGIEARPSLVGTVAA